MKPGLDVAAYAGDLWILWQIEPSDPNNFVLYKAISEFGGTYEVLECHCCKVGYYLDDDVPQALIDGTLLWIENRLGLQWSEFISKSLGGVSAVEITRMTTRGQS